MNSKPVILCVDDERPVLSALQRLLRHEPYELIVAQSPREALDHLRSRDVSLVITDQRMAEMRGSDFLQRVHEISPDTRRVMLTGYPDFRTVMDRVHHGVQRLITKPWRDEELKRTIRTLVDAPRPVAASVRRLRGEPEVAEAVFRVEAVGRTAAQVNEELNPMIGDIDANRGMTVLLSGLRSVAEPPMAFLRGVIEPLIYGGIATTLIEDLGCGGVLAELLGRPPFLEIFSPDPTRGRKVLLLADHDEVNPLLADVIETVGHTVEVTRSSFEAARILERTSFDRLILDLDIAEGEAAELADLMRCGGREPSLIALSSHSRIVDSPSRKTLGLRRVLEKPYWVAEVLRAIGPTGE